MSHEGANAMPVDKDCVHAAHPADDDVTEEEVEAVVLANNDEMTAGEVGAVVLAN